MNWGPVGPTRPSVQRICRGPLTRDVGGRVGVALGVDAKRYVGGDLWTYLRHAIAPFFRGDPTTLLTAGRNAGLRPVLIIDALNECAQTRRDEFLKGIQAFTLHYDARIVVSDHQE